MTDWLGDIRSGDRAALGRALTLVESRLPADQERAAALVDACLPHVDGAAAIAITGLPGAGKSTLTDRIGAALVEAGHRVAVLAVDPSSTRTGGSILGDKTRMERLGRLDGAFIRPSPTGGALGGVTATTRASLAVCAAAGYDRLLVETVGVGQSEISVASMVDAVILVTLAGGGDALQGIKRGILEACDLVLVNKADGEGRHAAEQAARALSDALHVLRPDDRVDVRPVSALTGDGLGGVVSWIESRAGSSQGGILGTYPADLFDEVLVRAITSEFGTRSSLRAERDRLRDEVEAGRMGPHEAALALARRITLAT